MKYRQRCEICSDKQCPLTKAERKKHDKTHPYFSPSCYKSPTKKEDLRHGFICIKCGVYCDNVGNYIYKDHCIPCAKKLLRERNGAPKETEEKIAHRTGFLEGFLTGIILGTFITWCLVALMIWLGRGTL